MTTACGALHYNENALSMRLSAGMGEDARFIIQKQTQIREEREGVATSINKRQMRSTLVEAYLSSRQPGWDGYQAMPVSVDSFKGGLRLIELLPSGIPMPEIVADANGEFVFEWYRKKRHIVSITMENETRLLFVALFGPSKVSGVDYLEDDLPAAVFDSLVRLFG